VIAYKIVEKRNHLAAHALCDTKESAERWLTVDCVYACEHGFFMDKTLTPDDFEIIPPKFTEK
jgi:hypothetical protein